MTTIAFRDGTLASDSQMTGDFKEFNTQKIFRKKVGKKTYVLAGAGEYEQLRRFIHNFKGVKSQFNDPVKLKSNEMLIWDGVKLWYVYDEFPVEVTLDYYAIGSGANIAMGAMFMGATAEEAVEAAIALDIGSGGEIQIG